MAGDWIKMRSNLDTDPRVIEMASVLNVDELHVIGMLWKVWSWADSHTLNGNAIRVTSVTLDRFTHVTGFANALRNVGWLDGEEGLLSFPRFTEHNGRTAKNRAETKERVAKHRNANTVTSVTQTPLPEKRREEKNVNTVDTTKKTEQGWTKPEGVDDEAWVAWMNIRKAKRAKNTQYAWNIILKEAIKAEMNICEVVERCARGTGGSGWVGFEAKYVEGEKPFVCKVADMEKYDREKRGAAK